MAVLKRVKRVTDPLDNEVKASIYGKDHRKTTHNGEFESDDSNHLSDLIHKFLEEESTGDHNQPTSELVNPLSDSDDHNTEFSDSIKDLLHKTTIIDGSDSFRAVLYSQVTKAIEIFSCFNSNKTDLQKQVMMYLRDSGYNAGICKTESESSGGLRAGNYEFIDVIRSYNQQRYIVDVDFAGEFEIARATNQYQRLLEMLPRVYVGRCEELKKIVKTICEAAKRSYESNELHFPPWRKNRYMQMKWFGLYNRRTVVCQIPASSSSSSSSSACRWIGFEAVNGGGSSNCRFVVK